MAAAILNLRTPPRGAGDLKYAYSGLGRKMPFKKAAE
jgi:hypothetical protein